MNKVYLDNDLSAEELEVLRDLFPELWRDDCVAEEKEIKPSITVTLDGEDISE